MQIESNKQQLIKSATNRLTTRFQISDFRFKFSDFRIQISNLATICEAQLLTKSDRPGEGRPHSLCESWSGNTNECYKLEMLLKTIIPSKSYS